MKAFVVRALLTILGSVLLASGAHADWNPASGCDVHLRRTAAANFNFQEICTPEAVNALNEGDPYPEPCQYTDLSSCGSLDWPLTIGGYPVASEPDRGYRYPLVRTDSANSAVDKTQLLGLDEWPVCVNDDESVVTSNPNSSDCGELHRVGTCRAAAHYYERLGTPNASRPGKVFYTFVHDESTCTPCGHDVPSAVEACRHLCRRYFGKLRYDPAPGSAVGAWSLVAASGETGSLGAHPVTVPNWADLPALAACEASCGPPNPMRTTTPWVSTLGGDASTGEQENHWFFVEYGRGWNPNDNLDNWLRSYSVNRDKPTAPAKKCQTWVNSYCNTFTGTAEKIECKKGLLRLTAPLDAGTTITPTMFLPAGGSTFQLNLPGDKRNDPTVSCSTSSAPDDDEDGFCTHFYRGNLLCPETCYFRGNDGEFNGHHLCGGDTEKCLGDPGSTCDPELATCIRCLDGSGNGIPCPSAEIIYPTYPASVPASQASIAVSVLLRDGNGNALTDTTPPAPYPSGRWVALSSDGLLEGSMSYVWVAWHTPQIPLASGTNIVAVLMYDQFGNVASAVVAIEKP